MPSSTSGASAATASGPRWSATSRRRGRCQPARGRPGGDHRPDVRERRVLGRRGGLCAAGSAGSRVTPDGRPARPGRRRCSAKALAPPDRDHPGPVRHGQGGATRPRADAPEFEMMVSFDVNLRRRLWSDEVAGPVLRPLAERSDVVFGSPDELAVLTGPATRIPPCSPRRAGHGPAVAVVKRGADGAFGPGTGWRAPLEPGASHPHRWWIRSGRVMRSVPASSPPDSKATDLRLGAPERERVRGRRRRRCRRPGRAAGRGSNSRGSSRTSGQDTHPLTPVGGPRN